MLAARGDTSCSLIRQVDAPRRGSGWLSYRIENPWIWAPLAVLQGFVILSFIILLHEQVHNLIFSGPATVLGARARALLRASEGQHLGQPVQAVALGPPPGAGDGGRRPQAGLPLAQEGEALVQAPLHGRPFSS